MAGKNENKNYLSGREIRAIAKANAKEIKRLEAYKNRKAPESEFLSEMKDPANILEIEDLHTYFYTEQGVVKAVGGVSYDVPKHSVVGVVGESGCGKSVTSMSVMRLIQGPTGQIAGGSIRFQAYDYKRDENGDLVYSYGVIMNYLFSLSKLEEIVDKKIPVHIVEKKIDCLCEDGETRKPDKENGKKFETLAVDLIKPMGSVLPFEVVREHEFAPIKNKTGVDSVESARELLKLNGVEL